MNSVFGDTRPNCLILDEIDGAMGGSEGRVCVSCHSPKFRRVNHLLLCFFLFKGAINTLIKIVQAEGKSRSKPGQEKKVIRVGMNFGV